MSELRTYERRNAEPTGFGDQLAEKELITAYPTLIKRDLTIRSKEKMEVVEVYTLQGALLKVQEVSGNEAVLSFEGIQPGFYLLRVNDKIIRVIKE